MKIRTFFHRSCATALLGFLAGYQGTVCAATNATFATPAQAVTALGRAVNATNRAALIEIFGPDSEYITNPDPVQGAREFADFAAAFNATNSLSRESDARLILEVGQEAWPFPIPLIKTGKGWQFDTASGLEEIANRRIGRNELEVLRAMRAYVQAQREYASYDRDADDVMEFAQKISSSPGLTDGLYWPFELNGEISPLGPLVAQAHSEGYIGLPPADGTGPLPFHGYLFKVFKRQGKHAAGGKYEYVINGNMIGGFGLVAWPVEYGESGVMTFIVNQRGRVYQRDLGAETAKVVHKMNAYDPEPGWSISPD